MDASLSTRAFARTVAVGAGIVLSGCSIAIPISPLFSSDDVTGSVKKPAQLARVLNKEDLQRAEAALNKALVSADSERPITWENPRSGSKGSLMVLVKAAGDAASGDCRVLAGEVTAQPAGAQPVQGAACRQPDGTWAIRDASAHEGA